MLVEQGAVHIEKDGIDLPPFDSGLDFAMRGALFHCRLSRKKGLGTSRRAGHLPEGECTG
jgi:hypothetical protein